MKHAKACGQTGHHVGVEQGSELQGTATRVQPEGSRKFDPRQARVVRKKNFERQEMHKKLLPITTVALILNLGRDS